MPEPPVVQPLPFVRRPFQHRYQSWAPKLGRSIVLTSWPAVQIWAMIEADPAISTYCERPATARVDGSLRLVDFWLQREGQDYWFVIAAHGESLLEIEPTQEAVHNIDFERIRFVDPKSLEEHAMWIENWLAVLPYLANATRLVEPALVSQVVTHCRRATALWTIEQAFKHIDRMLVRTAVFMALSRGALMGLDFRDRRWDLNSQFIAPTHRSTRAA